jgi:hypothetical protein
MVHGSHRCSPRVLYTLCHGQIGFDDPMAPGPVSPNNVEIPAYRSEK